MCVIASNLSIRNANSAL